MPAFRERYEPTPRLVPNLGFDLVMAALRPVASIETSGRIFLTLVVALFALGCHLVGAGFHGRPTWTAPVATWFTWNFFTSWGLLGYLLSLALFLFALGTRCDTGKAVLNAAAVAAPLVLLVPYLLASAGVPMGWWHPILLKKLVGLGYPFVAYGAVFDLVSGALLVALMAAWLWPTRGATVEAGGAAAAIVLLGLFCRTTVSVPAQSASQSPLSARPRSRRRSAASAEARRHRALPAPA